MRIYYTFKFKTEEQIQHVFFDGIAFTSAKGTRYSIDILGDHDYTVNREEDGTYTIDGRIKGDCNWIANLSKGKNVDFKEVRYKKKLYKLLKKANEDDFEFVLAFETPENRDDVRVQGEVVYRVELELNSCETLKFEKGW